MIKVLKGSNNLIRFLKSKGGTNDGGLLGLGRHVYYYIDDITNIIQYIEKEKITEKYFICNSYKEYECKQKLINYLEI